MCHREMVFADMSKAFDGVRHHYLVNELTAVRVGGTVLKLLVAYQ